VTFGSLFAGIGGFDLGFERAGLVCVWQVEINEFCRRVLAKHWPAVRRHDDVRTFPDGDPEAWKVDVICGGFPCQDISTAGPKSGLAGERSGLWAEYARVVRVLRPRFVVVENVSAILVRGVGTVLGDLAALGYVAEGHCIPAAYVGAPIGREGRDRFWLVAHADGGGCGRTWLPREADRQLVAGTSRGGVTVPRLPGATPDNWLAEPGVGRVADGVPNRVDRLRALGNAVVPQVAEWIGRRLIEADTRDGGRT
jgi:DNA (cytosine-5)-methyltransferase 1